MKIFHIAYEINFIEQVNFLGRCLYGILHFIINYFYMYMSYMYHVEY